MFLPLIIAPCPIPSLLAAFSPSLPPSSPSLPPLLPSRLLQVCALLALRDFTHAPKEGQVGYQPTDPEIIELLKRDPHKDDKHPFQAAMDDCLMITIKGISAAMQNTG
jgi:phosphoenolpyruvate carboxylase